MLELILGRAGTGKTTRLYEILSERVKEGKEAIFLMPEQFSFETEKAIYRLLGANLAQKVKVLSFTRLSYEIFKQYGGLKKQLSDMEKQLLMAVTLNELKDNLNVYGAYKKSSSFITSMVTTIDDFKSAGISDVNLLEITKNGCERELSEKLTDLSIIYSAYNAVLERSGADPKDNLTKSCEKAAENGYFNDKVVFIDCFMAFSPSEHQMLSIILEQAKEVIGAFCCDGINDKTGGMGVFSPVNLTLEKMIANCRENGIEVKIPEVLLSQKRFTNESLTELEEQFMSEHLEGEKISRGIKVFAAQNPYNEMMYIAAEIKKIVTEKKMRYNEIAVITRDFSRYKSVIQRIFDRYKIPYYMDKRVDIYTTPLIIGIKAVIDSVYNNFETEHILKFAKSPMSKLTPIEAAMLDNYCYTWSINGKKWTEEFTGNPNGISDKMTTEDEETLKKINSYRLSIIEPICQFKDNTSNCDGKTYAKSLFELMNYFEPFNRMTELSENMGEDNMGFIQLQGRAWECLVDILDVFARVIGDKKMSFQVYNELLSICLSSCDLGQIPQTLDHVIVGMADRVRPDKVKAVFVMGCIEGEFPLNINGGGILSDKERRKIGEMGLELTASIQERESYENHYAYFAVTRASELLFVSYPMSDLTGKDLSPSRIYEEVLEITGLSPFKTYQGERADLVWNWQTAMEQLAENFDIDDEYKASMEEFLKQEGKEKLIKNIENGRKKQPKNIDDKRTIQDIFGKNIVISPSKLEKFYNCRFSYFANNGLKIRERKKVEMSPIESGLLIHYVLEKMVEKYGRGLSKLEPKELKTETTTLLEKYLSDRIDEKNLTSRLKYLFDRLRDTLVIILEHLGRELEQTAFLPMYFEEKIGKGQRFEPQTFVGTDGTQITIEGYVDRIDVMEQEGKSYIRVVDYKSGNKAFNISDVKFGLNMQMLIYLFAICPECMPYSEMKPAGILYMPAKNAIVTVSGRHSNEEIKLQKDETLKMNGLVLKEQAVIYGMEQGGNGIFVPAKMTDKDEIDGKSSAISLKEMKKLKEIVEENIIAMADILESGDVEAIPVNGMGYDPCEYCQYKVACGHQDDDKIRLITKIPKQDLLGGEENE
ncbi:MAG: PD-(D/E)XK nuclease family protein [Oscillospiraceae bacterium]